VVEVVPNKKWVWLVTDGQMLWLKDTTEWKNTQIVFEISEGKQQTRIDMTHIGLVPAVECYKSAKMAGIAISKIWPPGSKPASLPWHSAEH
jgi:hypothetical protein